MTTDNHFANVEFAPSLTPAEILAAHGFQAVRQAFVHALIQAQNDAQQTYMASDDAEDKAGAREECKRLAKLIALVDQMS